MATRSGSTSRLAAVALALGVLACSTEQWEEPELEAYAATDPGGPIRFQLASANPIAFIDRAGTYETSPTAMLDQGVQKTWWCGGYDRLAGAPLIGDTIYYAANQPTGQVVTPPVPVLPPAGFENFTHEDAAHACAPSVVKNSAPEVLGGQELYLLYYECAPILFERPSMIFKGLYTQTCLAASVDGIHFAKYNEGVWDSTHAFGDAGQGPTPVVALPQKIKDNIQYQRLPDGRHTIAQVPDDFEYNYGVGHPSAVVVDVDGRPQVWLYYWNSGGDAAGQGEYLARSWDGIHFDPPVKTPMPRAGSVAYYPGVIGHRTGVFFEMFGSVHDNLFAYSSSEAFAGWTSSASDVTTRVKADTCITGPGVIVTDKRGQLGSLSNLSFLSVEGYLGDFDDGMTAGCYSAQENAFRGATWGFYSYTGSFVAPPTRAARDFDGDGKTDLTVFKPSSGIWTWKRSATGALSRVQWGGYGDVPVPRDYDGDGKADFAVWRPSDAKWYVKRSTGGNVTEQWGASGDEPAPGDYDGDGKTDFAIWRPTDAKWYVKRSSGGYVTELWGAGGDRPAAGDFDGDGKTDFAIWRPADATWYVKFSSGGNSTVQWGATGDVLVPADYDGDGRTDVAIWRPSDAKWYVKLSSGGNATVQWGSSGDVPVPGDHDGDGKADFVTWRPSNATWYVKLNATEVVSTTPMGASGDLPPSG